MQYVVLDLEWNQAMSPKSTVFLRLPFRLRGEIIQIGAVKLNHDLEPDIEFSACVKPRYFKRLHHKVKKLTGLDRGKLKEGKRFDEAIEMLRIWCEDETTFLTWGDDDRGILEQNLILYDIDADWIAGWINLQHIYNLKNGQDKNQKSLASAMECFDIEQTRTAHDALGDAYNTAMIASRLRLGEDISRLSDSEYIKSAFAENKNSSASVPLERISSHEYSTVHSAFSDKELTVARCPVCGEALENSKWVNQGNHRYMTLAGCREHGLYLVRLKLRKNEFGLWLATRMIYESDEDMKEYYNSKAAKAKYNRKRKTSGNTDKGLK